MIKRLHPIEIQHASVAEDGYGGQAVAWRTDFVWWANVRGVRGREEERSGRLASVETYVLTGRYDPRITTEHRALWDGKALNVRNVQDRDGLRHETTIEAEAGVTT